MARTAISRPGKTHKLSIGFVPAHKGYNWTVCVVHRAIYQEFLVGFALKDFKRFHNNLVIRIFRRIIRKNLYDPGMHNHISPGKIIISE